MPLAYIHLLDSSPESPPPRPTPPPQVTPWPPLPPDATDPGYGHPAWGPVDPGYGRPEWGYPSHGLPGAPVYPSGGPIWSGELPTHPIYHPDKPVPPGETAPPTKPVVPPDSIYPPLPPTAKPGWLLVWLIGVGYRWMHVGHPDNTLPPTAEPR